jgi:hypothetical protein
MTDPPTDDPFQRRARAELLRIQSEWRKDRKIDRLEQAYNVYAHTYAGERLSDELLTKRIPGLVLEAAVTLKWLPHPSLRPRGRTVRASFLRSVATPPPYEPIPRSELTDTIGGYNVTAAFAGWFMSRLEYPIARYQAQMAGCAATADAPIEHDLPPASSNPRGRRGSEKAARTR